MFFKLSKLTGFVVFHPLNFLVLALCFGLALGSTRFARAGRRILAAAVVLLVAAAVSPLGSLLLRPLEDRFPRPPADMSAPTGIVVLGGALDEEIGAARNETTLTEAGARLTAGVELARRYPQALLVFTGGSADLTRPGRDEARGVRTLWLALGVAPERMRFEDRSRNTYENAAMTRELVAPQPGQRWLLVTSAAHMPRAVGLFRGVGWEVAAYPVDYRTFGTSADFHPTVEALDAMRRLDTALHEWVGLVAYRLAGRTRSLFPSP